MTHPEQQRFIQSIKDKWPHLFDGVSVLEIGSRNINGTVREFFEPSYYLGVDAVDGTDVDVVAVAHRLRFEPGSFDVVITTECLEHDPYWKQTLGMSCQVASKMVLVTCASIGRQEHGTARTDKWVGPDDEYYNNLSMLDLFDVVGDVHRDWQEVVFGVNNNTCDLYFAATTPRKLYAYSHHRDGALS